MSDADSSYENHLPDIDPPDTALNDPYRFITWLRTIDARLRFQYEDLLTNLIRTRPATERDFLLQTIKDLGFAVGTMREKLKQLGKMEGTKFRARSTYVTKDYLAEMVYRPDVEPHLDFLIHFFDKPGQSPEFVEKIKDGDTEIHPLGTPLVERGVIMLPSQYEEYGSDEELFAEIHSFMTRYVVVDGVFSKLATAWIMYSWVADRFSVCVYLRIFGELGTAKTQFETVLGHIAYRGILAAGATTSSPIFRIVDTMRGTLVIDEADHERNNAEWTEILKLLNTGTQKSHHVLRSERGANGEAFDVHAYNVFGPKLVASREPLRDAAFESRCLFHTMKWVSIRELSGVPLFLDEAFFEQAQRLRNKLVLWRFRNYRRVDADPLARIAGVDEARVTANGLVLLSAITDPTVRRLIEEQLVIYSQQLRASRGQDTVAGAIAQNLLKGWVEAKCPDRLLVKAITERVQRDLPQITYQRVGRVLHGSLGLRNQRAGGDSYIIGLTWLEMTRLAMAYDVDLVLLAQTHGIVLTRTPIR